MKKNRPRGRRAALQRDLAMLVALGYLKPVAPGIYTITPKGKTYVQNMGRDVNGRDA